MNRKICLGFLVSLLSFAFFPAPSHAQQDSSAAPPVPPLQVPAGTRFLVSLRTELNTREDQPGKHFKATTLEPLVSADGTVVPPGAEVRGHVSRVEPGHITGRARLWLSFDDLKTPHGRVPLIADVVQVPGEHSVKSGESTEGEIDARTSTGKRDAEAAVTGAAIGGVNAAKATHDKKDAAVGAAYGGISAFLVSSGLGQELDLEKNTKLELELIRPLYLATR
ncbi:MAG: hypothetical protein ACRD50_16100 [Candidatus Acidiferrales bacterium]